MNRLPITKPCPLCGGSGIWTSDHLIRCMDGQCDFITSHYYWHSIAILLKSKVTGNGE